MTPPGRNPPDAPDPPDVPDSPDVSGPPGSRQEYLRAWSALHGGAQARGLVGVWIGIVYRVARPTAGLLARWGGGPDALTVAGVLVALAVPGATDRGPGPGWFAAASVLAAGSGVMDGLDGAVALIMGRTSARGFVLDSVCDRLAEAAFGAAFWLAGAPGPLVVAGVALAWLHEYARARSAVAGMSEIGVVTVSERPTRVIITVMFLLGAALYPASASHWATAGAAAAAVVGAVGLGQLSVTIGRRLSGSAR